MTETYRLVLRAGAARLAIWPAIELRSGTQWEKTFRLPERLPPRTRVEADLYRGTHLRVVYRHVTFRTLPLDSRG